MNKRKPVNVRAAKARIEARNLLAQYGFHEPSVPIKKVIKKVARLFYFYNWQHPEFKDEEGFSQLINGEYRVYINADLPSGRDNFTYGHEFAHIVLKHHEEFDVDDLNDAELWRLDREANIFAANFLMPENWVLNSVQLPITVQEIGRLKKLFNVSWEAMINRLDELSIIKRHKVKKLFTDWYQEKVYASEQKALRLSVSRVLQLYKGINYCTCIPRKVVFMSPITIPEMDANYRFKSCPRCGNHVFSVDAKYCKNCGQYLFNECLNVPSVDLGYCGKPNVPDAKYCEYCGSLTVMGKAFEDYEQQQKTSYEESAPTIDNDLPF